MYTWGANGIYFCDGGQESEHDLIEVKPERWYPIGISEFGNYSLYSKPSSTKEAALAVVFDSAVDIRTIDAWKAPE